MLKRICAECEEEFGIRECQMTKKYCTSKCYSKALYRRQKEKGFKPEKPKRRKAASGRGKFMPEKKTVFPVQLMDRNQVMQEWYKSDEYVSVLIRKLDRIYAKRLGI